MLLFFLVFRCFIVSGAKSLLIWFFSFLVDLHTPQIWYNTSVGAPPGGVTRGGTLNITCFTSSWYPGGFFQLRLIRSNGTVRHSVSAPSSSRTFFFPNAQAPLEGYYRCAYHIQMGGRTFISRESQPLPISVRGELWQPIACRRPKVPNELRYCCRAGTSIYAVLVRNIGTVQNLEQLQK